jgi:hypothetical protein
MGHSETEQGKGSCMPSKEHPSSTMVSIRVPDALLARLDRYL